MDSSTLHFQDLPEYINDVKRFLNNNFNGLKKEMDDFLFKFNHYPEFQYIKKKRSIHLPFKKEGAGSDKDQGKTHSYLIKRSGPDIYLGWYLTLRYNAEKIRGRHKVAKCVFWFQRKDYEFISVIPALLGLPSLYLGRLIKNKSILSHKPLDFNIPSNFFDEKNFVRLSKEPLFPVRQSLETGINHSNLTNFLGVDLYTAIKSNYYSLDVLSSLIKHLYYFLVYLHKNNIVIMDLKPENILIEERGGNHRLVIIDQESWRSLDNMSNPQVSIEALTLNKDEQSYWSKSIYNLYQYSQQRLTTLGNNVVSLFFKLLDLRCYISILNLLLSEKPTENIPVLPNIADKCYQGHEGLYNYSVCLDEIKKSYDMEITNCQKKLHIKSVDSTSHYVYQTDSPYTLDKKVVPSCTDKSYEDFFEEPRRSRLWCCC